MKSKKNFMQFKQEKMLFEKVFRWWFLLIMFIIAIILTQQKIAEPQEGCLPNLLLCSEGRIDPADTTLQNQDPDDTIKRFKTWCYDIRTYKLLPCLWEVYLNIVKEGCDLTKTHRCGHVFDMHNPNEPTGLDVKGGLTERDCKNFRGTAAKLCNME